MGKRIMPRAALCAALVTAIPALSACGDVKDPQPDVVAGKQLFVSKCGSCHTLARADTKGTTGPDLDAAFKQALADGQGRTVVKGVVYAQILHPANLANHSTGTQMPAGLVKGQKARDVAAYVATSAAKPGKDAGLLAEAVKAAGSGKPAVEKGGVLQIDADPGGQ